MRLMIRRPIKNEINEKCEKCEKNDVCIICLDDRTAERPLKLFDAIHQLKFFTRCSCSCDVHKICMKEWINVSPKCPICRTMLIKYNGNDVFHYLLNPPSPPLFINERGRHPDGENVKKMIMMMITIPIYLGMHLIIFYISTYLMVRIVLSTVV